MRYGKTKGSRDMDKQQLAISLEAADPELWITSYVGNLDKAERWIWIASVSEYGVSLGISEGGYWVIEAENIITPIVEGKHLRDLLPCLKMSPDEMTLLITKNLTKRGLSVKIWDGFPLQDLVMSGLKSRSDFWANLALNWVEEFPTTTLFAEELEEIIGAEWVTQKTRHKAKKILKRKS